MKSRMKEVGDGKGTIETRIGVLSTDALQGLHYDP